MRGYIFCHANKSSGARFNKTVEKIAEHCGIEQISKEVYYLILFGKSLNLMRMRYQKERYQEWRQRSLSWTIGDYRRNRMATRKTSARVLPSLRVNASLSPKR